MAMVVVEAEVEAVEAAKVAEAEVVEVAVEVAVMAAVVAAVVVAMVAVAARAVAVQLQRGRQEQEVTADGDDGWLCNSWDRCCRCTVVQPAPHQGGRRADRGSTRHCTNVGCCRLAWTACLCALDS